MVSLETGMVKGSQRRYRMQKLARKLYLGGWRSGWLGDLGDWEIYPNPYLRICVFAWVQILIILDRRSSTVLRDARILTTTV